MKVRPKQPRSTEPAANLSEARLEQLCAARKAVVLDASTANPAEQVNLDWVITRILTLAQLLAEKRFYPTQLTFGRRLLEGLLLHDGEVITALFSRQSGKTETVGSVSAAAAIALPYLAKKFPRAWMLNLTDSEGNYRGFANGLQVGIYAPKLEQASITFNRAKQAINTRTGQQVLGEFRLKCDINNGNTLAFTNGSRLLCQSASVQSDIEGATHHLLVVEEAQDVDDLKVRKSLMPMVASTMGTVVKVGTASIRRSDFYTTIQHNRRRFLLTGVRSHFVFPANICARYNSLYARYIERERERLGADSDEYRMAYGCEFIFERGMFVSSDVLFSPIIAHTSGIWANFNLDRLKEPFFRAYRLVLGIDWGSAGDSTVVALLAVNWKDPLLTYDVTDHKGRHQGVYYRKHLLGFWEWEGDNYEVQYQELFPQLVELPGLARVVMDANACGLPLYHRMSADASTLPQPFEVVPFTSSAKAKSEAYKGLSSDFSMGRITIPASPAALKEPTMLRFVTQMLDLRKTWKNGVLHISHSAERGAHDDYPDALCLGVHGCNLPYIELETEYNGQNPFFSHL